MRQILTSQEDVVCVNELRGVFSSGNLGKSTTWNSFRNACLANFHMPRGCRLCEINCALPNSCVRGTIRRAIVCDMDKT